MAQRVVAPIALLGAGAQLRQSGCHLLFAPRLEQPVEQGRRARPEPVTRLRAQLVGSIVETPAQRVDGLGPGGAFHRTLQQQIDRHRLGPRLLAPGPGDDAVQQQRCRQTVSIDAQRIV